MMASASSSRGRAANGKITVASTTSSSSARLPLRLLLLVLACAEGAANHYKTLGVPRESTADMIKAAYRKLALKHHPDKIPKSASAELRKSSQRTFELANAAFEVLSDPAQRRQYDFDLANPIKKREDGTFARGEQGQTPLRPSVEVTLPNVKLQQLGGWEGANVPLDAWTAALGATVTKELAQRLGLPLTIQVPPGSRHGDSVRYTIPTLGPQGVDVVFRLMVPQDKRWERSGDDLRATVTISAWHRLVPMPVRLRGVDGDPIELPRGAGETKLEGRGMPVAGTGDNPRACERGQLRVTIKIRSVVEEAVHTVDRLVVAAAVGLAANVARQQLPVLATRVTDGVFSAFAEAVDFLSNEVLGRARPEARRARMRAAARVQAERASRRAEKEAERARQERERRMRALSSKAEQMWEPIRRRLRQAWVWAFES